MKRSFIPILGLIFFSLLVLLLKFGLSPSPVLISMEPAMGRSGTPIVLYGQSFGELNSHSQISFPSGVVTRSDIESWTETQIRCLIPEEARSGPVKISTNNGTTEGLFWVNQSELPVPLSGGANTGALITKIEPALGKISDLIVLSGKGFGTKQGEVLFTWGPLVPGLLEGGMDPWVSAPSYDIESWTDAEIRVHIPSGVTSGNVIVKGLSGPSNGAFLEVDTRYGLQLLNTRRRLALSRKVEVVVDAARSPNRLRLWAPWGVLDALQRSPTTVRQTLEPSFNHPSGVSAYDIYDLKVGKTVYEWEYLIHTFSVQASIKGNTIPELTPYPGLLEFLTSDESIPWNTELFRNISLNVGGWPGPGRSPYDRARGLFNWMATQFRWNEPTMDELEGALRVGRGAIEQGCRIFIGLLRASKIPARLVKGYLISGNDQLLPHFWVEFFLTGLGWISSDPYLGSGASPVGFFLPPEPRDYYLGNLDNRRIALGKSDNPSFPVLTGSTIRTGVIPQATHQVQEEVQGSLENYTVIWHSLELMGVY